MVEKIVWSPKAISEYQEIVDFLMLTWDINTVLNFQNLISQSISNMSKNPISFPLVIENIRKVVIHKNVSLYYEFIHMESTIEILSIFDSRQNPNKLKL